jgi:calcium/calmodulin-dependent 3',5'-cyclic nucleotide phosphodiesterase
LLEILEFEDEDEDGKYRPSSPYSNIRSSSASTLDTSPTNLPISKTPSFVVSPVTLPSSNSPSPLSSSNSSSNSSLGPRRLSNSRIFTLPENYNKKMTENRVKSWLISTYSYSKNRKKAESDKTYLRTPSRVRRLSRGGQSFDLIISPECTEALQHRSEWTFNIFEFEKLTPHFDFLLVSHIFRDWNFFEKFQIRPSVLRAFIEQLELGYKKNPYHNFIHALDIFQTVHYLLLSLQSGFLDSCEIFALLVGALVHDLGHDGFNNTFHIRTFSPLALNHNDVSPQENHHLVQAFTILQNDEFNILSGLTPSEFTKFRSFMINAVLRTDMTYHFETDSQFKTLLMSSHTAGLGKVIKNSTQLLGAGILHLADIANPAKPFENAKAWAKKLLCEFHAQGDKERALGLPISPMCDRTSEVSVATGQIGFINFIVRPYFMTVTNIIPALNDTAIKILDENLQSWKSLEGKPIDEL